MKVYKLKSENENGFLSSIVFILNP